MNNTKPNNAQRFAALQLWADSLESTLHKVEAERSALERENEELRRIGSLMSNLCFNGKQHSEIPPVYRKHMESLHQSWDAALTKEGKG